MRVCGILISGIGYEDGTSIWDVAYVLKELERCSAKPLPIVPRISVEKLIPGPRRKLAPERDFLTEAKLMVRGEVFYIDKVDAKEIDVLIVPGGKGPIKILSSILKDGVEAMVLPEVRNFIGSVFAHKKPIATIGYGGVLVSFVLRTRISPIITIGDDAEMIEILKKIGADVVKVQPYEVIYDDNSGIFSTPGTSPLASLYRACLGIETMISELLKCPKKNSEVK